MLQTDKISLFVHIKPLITVNYLLSRKFFLMKNNNVYYKELGLIYIFLITDINLQISSFTF